MRIAVATLFVLTGVWASLPRALDQSPGTVPGDSAGDQGRIAPARANLSNYLLEHPRASYKPACCGRENVRMRMQTKRYVRRLLLKAKHAEEQSLKSKNERTRDAAEARLMLLDDALGDEALTGCDRSDAELCPELAGGEAAMATTTEEAPTDES